MILRLFLVLLSFNALAAERKPVPTWQAVPQPYSQVSFQRNGDEVARYHFGKELRRPFVYPLRGPGGTSVTRMGHPHDPESHSHHNSVWISHHDVNGVSFWDDRAKGRIVHQRIEKFEDSEGRASVISSNNWVDDTGKVLLKERRTTSAVGLVNQEWMLLIVLELQAEKAPVTFGKTPFGFIGVRMAKTIGVHDGGGTIRNSAGQVNEKEVFWKSAKWVDYSGLVTQNLSGGATLFDHSSNSNHPSFFHVRDDGWMGASFNLEKPYTLETNQTLKLTYGVYVHNGILEPAAIDLTYKQFNALKP